MRLHQTLFSSLHLIPLAIAVALPAQGLLAQGNVFVVDETGAPGSQFHQIQPAIDAASNGDRVLVRPGNYGGFSIVGKAITVAGAPGAGLGGFVRAAAIEIANVPAGSDCALSGMQIRTGRPYVPTALEIRNCTGRVLVEGLASSFASTAVVVVDSPEVLLTRVTGLIDLDVRTSSVTVSDSDLHGGFSISAGPRPAAAIVDSHVFFAGTALTGAPEFLGSSEPAIRMQNSHVTLTDDGTHAVAAGVTSAPMGAAAVAGTGMLVCDPRMRLVPGPGAPGVEPGVATSFRDIPWLSAGPAHPGAVLTLQVSGVAGRLFGLGLAAPASPAAVPGFVGECWILGPFGLPVAVGMLDAQGLWQGGLGLPATPGIAGLAFIGQAFTAGGGSAPGFGNAVPLLVRP